MKTKVQKHPAKISRTRPDYLALVTQFPLRPIRTVTQYWKAAAIVDRLSTRENLTSGERDYLEALALFIESYDQEHEPDLTEGLSPVEVLKALMEHRGMSPLELGEIIGSKTAATDILSGKRDISKLYMAKLAAEFRVDAGVFLEKVS